MTIVADASDIREMAKGYREMKLIKLFVKH
ncbi:hypothetical protein BDD39_001830 [Saccharococcus thermophilus]|uniref:Uncharacterized protein n=1 Tax=Saccharococcus thermophilus TaxID=29396 RepID=A0A846MFV4_9BACL|nr:hypothetical protein [Saccharococcus thermophilus]